MCLTFINLFFADIAKAVSPFIKNMPREYWDEFIEDNLRYHLATQYLEVNEATGEITDNYQVLFAVASKPL